MREMKDSGIEWVGQIPFSWDVKPIRAKFREVTEKNKLGIEKNALKFTYGNIVKKDNFDAADDDYVANTILNYMVVNPGTIMLNGLNLNFDFVTQRVALVKERGIITSAYIAFAPILDNDISAQFFTYLLKAYDSCKAFHNMGGGVRKILNFAELKKQYIVYPTLTEQKRIANFLDAKCEEIDALADDVQTQIETLEQYKRSIITEAVTKGIDQDVQLKNSGIECIGEIPSDWNIKRVKHIACSLSKGNGITREDVKEDGNIQCIRYGEIYSKYENSFKECISYTNLESIESPKFASYGDILFAGTGELIEEIGKNVVYLGISPCLVGGDIIIMRHNQNPSFLNYALNSNYAQMQKSRGKAKLKVVHISASDIGNIRLALPSIQEQKAISNFLDTKCSEINEIIMKRKEQLEVLNEYKKSLIYEYVTGKKEVPEI